ncbi:uncharacterized protein LOC110059312 [Orbicella faveolata]|uniref:uncharacterized protein LOC110059312 n=1 Tax=Orbicella faveolata TaxID=48498 RepID=UPI0009E5E741|nr:uncharacterized protein LOC110059312 [Orbicella faveolata]
MLLIFQMCLSSFLHFAYDNRKDHVKRELLSQRRWPDKWGFLANEYRQLQLETLRIGQDKLDIDEGRKQVSLPITGDSEENSATEPQTSSDVASTDKMSFPETSSQMIGWKSEVLQRKEVERNARGKQDIVKLFKWPREGV